MSFMVPIVCVCSHVRLPPKVYVSLSLEPNSLSPSLFLSHPTLSQALRLSLEGMLAHTHELTYWRSHAQGQGGTRTGHLLRIACEELPWGDAASISRSRCLDAIPPKPSSLVPASPEQASLALSLYFLVRVRARNSPHMRLRLHLLLRVGRRTVPLVPCTPHTHPSHADPLTNSASGTVAVSMPARKSSSSRTHSPDTLSLPDVLPPALTLSLAQQVEWRELTSAVPVALAVNAKRGLARWLLTLSLM